ncbi:hypothetical protein RB597_009058 [Gaeumannomyces tritici]
MAGNNEVHEVRIPKLPDTPHANPAPVSCADPCVHSLQGASVQERLIEACRRNNVDLLTEVIEETNDDDKMADLLNNTRTVMGNHLYHEAASQGNYEIIDMLLDQHGFECDPVNRVEGDTPLHTAIRWINSEPPAQREFGAALVEMMLEAGSNTRVRNKGGLTPLQLVDPSNPALKEAIRKHEYATLNAGDFVATDSGSGSNNNNNNNNNAHAKAAQQQQKEESSDDDAEFSGSDDEERAEWERRRRAKGKRA